MMSNTKLYPLKLSLLLCLFFCSFQSYSQVLYERDFLHADKHFRIAVEKSSKHFKVKISRLAFSEEFEITNLDYHTVFHNKLEFALDSIEIKSQKSFDQLLADTSTLVSIRDIIGYAPFTDTDKKSLDLWTKNFQQVKGFHPTRFKNTLSKALGSTYTRNRSWIEKNIVNVTEILNLSYHEKKAKDLVPLSNLLLAEIRIANDQILPTPKAGQLFIQKKAVVFQLEKHLVGITDSTWLAKKNKIEQKEKQAKRKTKKQARKKAKKQKVEIIETVDSVKTIETVDSVKTIETVDSVETIETIETVEKCFNKEAKRFAFDNSDAKKDSIIIDSVVIEFQESAAQNIKVLGKIKGEPVLFENRIPISYSKKGDVIQIADDNYLYTGLRDGTFYSLKLKNVLFLNNYSLHLFTENYAPKDQVITLKPGDTGTAILKEKTGKLLSTRIYTDFMGINENASNGLIQTEIDFSIPLNTSYSPFSNKTGAKKGAYSYIGGFNFIKPQFVLSKIENKNRRLLLSELKVDNKLKDYLTTNYPSQSFEFTDTAGNKQSDSYYIRDSTLYYASYLDVLKHQTMSAGFDINLILLGIPGFHSRFYLNFGMHVNLLETRRTETVLDTVLGQKTVLNIDEHAAALQIYPALVWEASPDSRLQLNLSYKPILYNVFNGYTFLPAYHKRKIEKNDYTGFPIENIALIHQIEGLVTYRVTTSNTIFGRFRYSLVSENSNEHFWQVQLGFSFDLNIKPKE